MTNCNILHTHNMQNTEIINFMFNDISIHCNIKANILHTIGCAEQKFAMLSVVQREKTIIVH